MPNVKSTVDIEAEGGGSKTCSVCGDKALGYNFNAVTCESCKAFFRRNALSNKEFTCPFTNDCKITIITRRFCQKCRLEKCFNIGMKKEYIMSEEDKFIKRKKIEQNRAKKRNSTNLNSDSNLLNNKIPIKIKREETTLDINDISHKIFNDNSQSEQNPAKQQIQKNKQIKMKLNISNNLPLSPDNTSFSTHSCNTNKNNNISNSSSVNHLLPENNILNATIFPSHLEKQSPEKEPYILAKSPTKTEKDIDEQSLFSDINQTNITSESLPVDIINCIINSKIGSKNIIDRLMRTPTDAVQIMSKIINSPKDAMELISHLISSPGDALHIISKIMNSPLDALTVFTQFMSSKNFEAFQIIGKVISCPTDVLQFMQQLMNSPEDALQIMNKYMNSPIEALKIINKMMNNEQEIVDSTTSTLEIPVNKIEDNNNFIKTNDKIPAKTTAAWDPGYSMIKLMLGSFQNDHKIATNKKYLDITTTLHNSSIESTPLQPTTKSTLTSKTHSATLPNLCCDKSYPKENYSINQTVTNTQTADIIKNIFEDIKLETIKTNSFDDLLCEAIRLEYDSYHVEEITQKLNLLEKAKLSELITANEALYAPVDESELDTDGCRMPSNSNQANPELLRVINLTAVAVRRLIKMAKKINAFKNMCQEDQLALLKGGCIEMMILRSLMQYDEDQHTWKIPHRKEEAMTNIKADVLKLAKGNIYEKHERFISNFDKKWRTDMNIIPIMCAITLFTPDRLRTVHFDVIKLEQTSYYCLLRRYLESIYPGCEAKSTFLKLLQKIRDLQKLNEEVINVYLDVNPAQIEPLLIEIFDLKTK